MRPTTKPGLAARPRAGAASREAAGYERERMGEPLSLAAKPPTSPVDADAGNTPGINREGNNHPEPKGFMEGGAASAAVLRTPRPPSRDLAAAGMVRGENPRPFCCERMKHRAASPSSHPSPEVPTTSNFPAPLAHLHPSGDGLLSPQSARHSKLSEQTPAAPGPDHDGTTIRPARVGPGVTGNSFPSAAKNRAAQAVGKRTAKTPLGACRRGDHFTVNLIHAVSSRVELTFAGRTLKESLRLAYRLTRPAASRWLSAYITDGTPGILFACRNGRWLRLTQP